jgi:hypothetical protein
LLEGEAWGDFDVPTFEKFQMVERSCREVEIDCRVVVGSWEGGLPEVLESAGVHPAVDNSEENRGN